MLDLGEREKPEYQSEKKKPLGAEKKTNNKLNPHMTPGLGIRNRESNLGHIGGRQALSPLRHPCSPLKKLVIFKSLRTGY